MFTKIQIANCSENGGEVTVSAKPDCVARAARTGEFPAGAQSV
jgi:hypothetical protein